MSQRITVTQGDNNIKLIFNILKDTRIESILGATIDLQFINSSTGDTMKRQCTISEASSAECMYILTSVDTQEVGGYSTELTITYANGTKITSPKPIILVVLPQTVID